MAFSLVVTLDADGLASEVAYLNDPNPGAFSELQYDPLRRGLIRNLIRSDKILKKDTQESEIATHLVVVVVT